MNQKIWYYFKHVEVKLVKKKNKRKVKIDFTFEAFKKWVTNYKLFSILMSIALVIVGLTLWDNRPNSMRTPNYFNTKDYNLVEGSFDFEEFHSLMNSEVNSTVKDVHFKLEEGYCFESNDVSMCINGYELFETTADVSVKSSYRLKNAKYFMVANIEIRNDRKNAIEVSEFSPSYSLGSDYSRPVKDTDFEIPNNLGNIKYDSGLIIKGNESYNGFVMYALSANAYRQLYFDGSLLVDMPQIYDNTKIDTQNIFTSYRVIDLPIAEKLMDSHIALTHNVPTELTRRANGFTTVTDQYKPGAVLKNSDETLQVTVDVVESGYFEYRQDYIANKRDKSYYQGKHYYRTMKVTLENKGNATVNTKFLFASLEPKMSTNNSRSYMVNDGLNVEPGEKADLIFSIDVRDSASGALIPGEIYKFVLSSENKMVLLEADFKLEQ